MGCDNYHRPGDYDYYWYYPDCYYCYCYYYYDYQAAMWKDGKMERSKDGNKGGCNYCYYYYHYRFY